MSEESARVTMMGMPGTGKTSFLAALYQQLTDVAPDGAAATLARQPTERTYLEELHNAWLNGKPVARTSSSASQVVDLKLLLGGRRVDVTVPDLAGELFERVLVDRVVTSGIKEAVEAADGLLVFLHPDQVRARVSIADARRAAAHAGEEFEPADQAPFDPRRVPGEVQLVDLLQWALKTRRTPTRLGLVISAWDRCGGAPDTWLEGKMPMLVSFLQGRAGALDIRTFGLSAQGGDYESGDNPAHARPHERAFVVDGRGHRSNDLTSLLSWAAFP